MGELDDFLAQVTPALQSADFAIHNGDPKPRIELWSHNDPVTIFGAVRNTTGWAETRQGFEWLASRFTRCDSFDFDVVAAGVSGLSVTSSPMSTRSPQSAMLNPSATTSG